MYKRLRKRFQRQFKRQQQQVELLGASAEKSIERNIFRRFSRLLPVRRFLIGWIALWLMIIAGLLLQFQQLSSYYQRQAPVPGGIYSEGIAGSISNVNPLYATSDVDRSISRLLFAGLMTFDTNNNLVGNLARDYQVGDNGKTYTVHLKPNLTWHDGAPITSADVVFTYNTIIDPDARSPLQASWRGINVMARDRSTVVFTLPSPSAAFPYHLTNGIVPQHVLGKIAASNLRSDDFNTIRPIGAGPFKWHGLQVNGNDPSDVEEQVALVPFDAYAGGKPKLAEFIIHAYNSQDHLEQVFKSGQLLAAAGMDSVPAGLAQSTQVHSLLLSAGTYVFFKNSQPVLANAKVRQALVLASNPKEVIDSLGYMTRPVTEPLLSGQLAFNASYAQKTGDLTAAKALLQQDGWAPNAKGILQKNGQKLQFNLVATNASEYGAVTHTLQRQWRALGVQVNVELLSVADYATTLANHDYDATLYGLSIGQDPDVYAYWHSSQADVRSANRLNLSEWKNGAADAALEAGRTRLDGQLRTIKYAPFLQAWQQDAPALGLYQPRYLYVTRGTVYGLTEHTINNGIDRYNDVQDWQIRTARVAR